VARDRQRAKQRKARRAGQNPGPTRSEPYRADVPGELEHASGEADEFDAALVAGAGGRTADQADDDVEVDVHRVEDEDADKAFEDELTEDALEADPAATGEIYPDELPGEDEADEDLAPEDEALAREAVAAAPARRGRQAAAAPDARHPAGHKRSAPARFIAFLRASWAELQRVQWPDRRQVAQATAVVLGFVVVAGLYLGVADRVAQELVDLIL
jgi:preprotein translocase subunit SecE